MSPVRGSAVGGARSLAVPILFLALLWGCAPQPPTPKPERIIVRTSRSNEYYSVRGMTTSAIMDEIAKNGLVDGKARRVTGLTSSNWNFVWRRVGAGAAYCRLEPMTIALDLVVRLPRHEQVSDLSPEMRANWQRFAGRVAAHEQRHVDIYLDGAEAVRSRMEAILTRPNSCAALETEIRDAWAGQQAETEQAQERFHVEDDARRENDRRPLQAQIDVNQSRLATIEAEIQGLDRTLEDIRRQRETKLAAIDAVKQDMANSGASPAACLQSRLTARVRAFCGHYDGLAKAHNALVEQHNETVARRNLLVGEHNRVVRLTNDLIETYNWSN